MLTTTLCYGAGLSVAWWRGEANTLRESFLQGGEPVPAYLQVPVALRWLVPEFDSISTFYRYPSWNMSDPGFYVPELLLVIAAATAGTFASIHVPPSWICRHLRGVPRTQRRTTTLVWRALLLRSPAPMAYWIITAAAGGLAVAFIGDAWAMISGHISSEQAWARGAPGTATFVKPFLGVLALPDATLMTAWVMLAPAALILGATRTQFMACEARNGLRCLKCGYPTAQAAPVLRRVNTQQSRCTECGNSTGAPISKRPPVRRLAAVLVIVVLASLLAFVIAPYLTRIDLLPRFAP